MGDTTPFYLTFQKFPVPEKFENTRNLRYTAFLKPQPMGNPMSLLPHPDPGSESLGETSIPAPESNEESSP